MSIPSFAQLIIRVLGLPMPSLFNPLFHVDIRGSTLPVDAALQLHLIAKGYSSSDSDGTLLDSGPVRIRTVRLMKCLGTLSEHEYLLVEFVSGHGRWPNVLGELMVERSYDPERGDPLKNAAADVFRASSQSSSLPAMSDEEPTPPKDTVTFIYNRHNASRDKVVFRYKFDEASAPSILDFLVAAAALNSHSPDHILPSRQCFWFAGMLLRVLLGDTNVDPQVSRGARGVLISRAFVPSSTDTALAEPVLTGRAGTFKKLFKIITKQEIDSYDSEIKQACELKRAEVNDRLEAPRRQEEAARAREEALTRQEEALARQKEALARQKEALREDAACNWAEAGGVLISPAFTPSSTDTALDAEPVLAGRAGTSKKLFKIITKQEIDSLYDSEIKQALELKRAEVNERLEAPRRRAEAARAREQALREETARQVEASRVYVEAMREETARHLAEAEASRVRAEALREEIARLKATGTERQGALPLAQ